LNAACDSQPILPLTENKSAVEAVIGQMRAQGSPNIVDGLRMARALARHP
jgi:hypothetical protein